jgi:hypothetical protein
MKSTRPVLNTVKLDTFKPKRVRPKVIRKLKFLISKLIFIQTFLAADLANHQFNVFIIALSCDQI